MKGRPPHSHPNRPHARPDAPPYARDSHERHHRPAPKELDDNVDLFGIHAVEAALSNPARVIRRLHATENAENRLAEAIAARGVKCARVTPRDLDRRLGPDTVHQGVLLETELLASPSLEELAADTRRRGPLVVLDQVTDPHNVGAILRSGAAFGARGLVMTIRNSPRLGGALAKAASGALEHVPVALVTNLARALAELAELGFERIGLDGEADVALEQFTASPMAALVLGAEGRGLRRLTRESCDRLCRITTVGTLGSLNVSNAAAVAMHWLSVQSTKSA
jgi:23S rRNA (guanosine2251-2'-O)-methyltransferase